MAKYLGIVETECLDRLTGKHHVQYSFTPLSSKSQADNWDKRKVAELGKKVILAM